MSEPIAENDAGVAMSLSKGHGAENYVAPDGYRYGVMFGDGSVAHYWNGRTQRERAEEFLVDVSTRWPRDATRYALVRCRPGEPWTRITSPGEGRTS